MESHKLVVKFFADHADRLPVDAAIPVFHAWIRDQVLADHLLIDVADYAHVPDGPGTVLVAHEANIHFDREGGRPGLTYVRKQPPGGAATFRERLAPVFHGALAAVARLEKDPAVAGIHFRTDEVMFRINDRLLAPNTDATFAAVRGDIVSFAAELFPGVDVALEHKADAQRLFEVRIKSNGKASVSDLLARLDSLTAPAR